MLPYLALRGSRQTRPYAKRGLSPGTQKLLTLTEGERVRAGLHPGRDVVPCVTTLRPLPQEQRDLDQETARRYYRDAGQKCWLIRTDTDPSTTLLAYLAAAPAAARRTQTCLGRKDWRRFLMPSTPDVLIAMSFKANFPKAVRNRAHLRAVGGVYGVYNLSSAQADALVGGLDGIDIRGSVVAHSHGLRKIEIGQLNALLLRAFGLTEDANGPRSAT